MMIPVIMNTNFERLAEIDDYVSFIWSTRYYAVGDFELCVPAEDNLSLFQKDYYVVRDDDENVGIIENVKIQSNEDGNELMIISGRFLPAILARRIIAVQTTVSGTISSCVNQLITENVINPTITARKIDNFTLGDYTISQTIDAQYTGKNLLETICDISQTYAVGFKTVLNDQNEFVWTMYEGVDHTYDQNDRPYVVFSDLYDNLLSSEYEEKYKDIATAVLVAGEGEGLDRKTVWVTDGNTGLQRHEIYHDQRNIRSDDGEISSADYDKLLQEEGKECLTQYTTAFAGTVYFGGVKYKEDVNVGDLCVIENSRWQIYMNARLVEVIESVSETGEYKIVPTFGV